MLDIYNVIIEYQGKRRERGEKEKIRWNEIKPYRFYAKALIMLGWRHTEVLDMLYSSFLSHTKKEERVNNNQLSKKLYYWRTKGMLEDSLVNLEMKRVNAILMGEKRENQEQKEVSARRELSELIGSSHNVLTFLKAYERRIGVECSQSEKLSLSEFYKANKKEDDVNVLVDSYLKSKASGNEVNI